MSIDDDLQPLDSITAGDRALDLFTDRYSFTRLLAERLNDPPKKEILFFHGAGGNGKSLLLKYLRTKICKGLTAQQWQQWQSKEDDELAQVLEELPATACLPVPTALLDFAPGPSGDKRRDSDPFYGLVRIREELAVSTEGTPYRLRFPLHTYGCFLYLQKTNRLDEAEGLFPFEEAELVKEFADLIEKPIPGLGVAISLFGLVDKYSGNQLARYKKRFRLSEAEVGRLQQMDAEKELLLELPRLLAQDLNVAMAGEDSPHKPRRVVFFFDTHESFYGSERDHAKNFFRDGWLRRLLRKLDMSVGIVVVVAGRDKPRWADANAYELHTQIPTDYVRLKSVDDLAESDAEMFLRRAGVADATLRESLIRYASVAEGEVHPLHLGLCVDVVREAAAKGVALVSGDFSGQAAFQQKSDYLVGQLLKYVNEGLRDAIRAVSACRAFDFEIYRLLGEKLSFAVDRATFQKLVGFSFVRQVAQRGDEWFRIHDLLRRLEERIEIRQAHRVLMSRYQTLGLVDWIYHLAQLDCEQGVVHWIKEFNIAVTNSQYELCRFLLDIRKDLAIEQTFQSGTVADAEGHYFQTLSLYDKAEEKYHEAVASHDKTLSLHPNHVGILNNKGLSLHRLASLQSLLSRYDEAEKSYKEAISVFEVASREDPSYAISLSNKGNSLQFLADLQLELSEYSQALYNYKAALYSYTLALQQNTSDINALNGKGLTLRSLADLQAAVSNYDEAAQNYLDSISTFKIAIAMFPNNVSVLGNMGSSIKGLADLQVLTSEYIRAKESYAHSIRVCRTALFLAPEYVDGLDNLGNALSKLADLNAMLSEYKQAKVNYVDSIVIYNKCLLIAPNYVYALNNKGLALSKLASVQTQLSEYQKALLSCTDSIHAFDTVLKKAPNDVVSLANKSLALQALGDLQVSLTKEVDARTSYKTSIEICEKILLQAPDYVRAIMSKALSLRQLAALNFSRSDKSTALDNLEDAMTLVSQAHVIAPDDQHVYREYKELTQIIDLIRAED